MAKNKHNKPQRSDSKPAEEEATGASEGKGESTDAPNLIEESASTSDSAPKDFESFYLQQITAEFADDLDRLRGANDFSERSVPILIEMLKQTAKLYSEEEKRTVMEKS